MSVEHSGAIAAGSQPTIELVATPGHPSNRVDVPYRVDRGPVHIAHAAPAEPAVLPEQTFLARLPALASGQRLEYRGELTRAGQLIAEAPPDGAWLSVTAEAPPPKVDLPSPHAPDTVGGPRFPYELEFLGALTVRLRPEVLGHTPEGYRLNFFVEEGEIRGPRLNGTVRPEGGDWMVVRPDGVGEAHIHVTYEMADGALVLEHSRGAINVGREGYERVIRGVFVGMPHLYLTPMYITADPRWAWVNTLQCFGLGRVVMEELRLECDMYAPHVRHKPSSA
jgi:Protein of unknown function (DUF3237)